MINNQEKIIKLLVEKGLSYFNRSYKLIPFFKIYDIDVLYNDLKNYPHFFFLACVMDRQIKAEKAWLIPYEISKILQSYDFKVFLEKDINYYKKIFADKKLHRFNKMYEYFYLAIEKIHYDYKNYAANIWNDNPKSATLIRRFLEFKGIGIKIASMAANTLA